jgi:soluble lytic murein transglycosylase-like protein
VAGTGKTVNFNSRAIDRMVRKTRRDGNLRIRRTRSAIWAVVITVALFALYHLRSLIAGRSRPADWTYQISTAIVEITDEFDLPPGLLEAICRVESSLEPQWGKGPAGEIGVMQVTPGAMQDTGYYINEDSTVAAQVASGAAYLDWLREYYRNNIRQFISWEGITIGDYIDWDWIIRAYNAGPRGAEQGYGFDYLEKVKAKWHHG